MTSLELELIHLQNDHRLNQIVKYLRSSFPNAQTTTIPYYGNSCIDLGLDIKDACVILHVNSGYKMTEDPKLTVEVYSASDNTTYEEKLRNAPSVVKAVELTESFINNNKSILSLSAIEISEFAQSETPGIVGKLFNHQEPSDYDRAYNPDFLGYNHEQRYQSMIDDLKFAVSRTSTLVPLLTSLEDSLNEVSNKIGTKFPNDKIKNGSTVWTSVGELEVSRDYSAMDFAEQALKATFDIIKMVQLSEGLDNNEKTIFIEKCLTNENSLATKINFIKSIVKVVEGQPLQTFGTLKSSKDEGLEDVVIPKKDIAQGKSR